MWFSMPGFFDSPWFSYLVLPLLIFLSRIMDVSIGTMRVIFVSRGYKKFAMICGFFEVLIWLVAITQIMKNLSNVFNYLAYAGGFATGNYIGMVIEEKIALGRVLIRIITPNDVSQLREYFRKNDYGATLVKGSGLYGEVNMLFTVIPRQEIEQVVGHIKEHNPHAFYTIEDIRFVEDDHLIYSMSNERSQDHRPQLKQLRRNM
jgi:uncharacterized protein YebE (UPF0316 family)